MKSVNLPLCPETKIISGELVINIFSKYETKFS